jgi:apoptosis-inducing factor 3
MGSSPRSDESGYYPAAVAGELVPDTMIRVEIAGRPILIANLSGQLHAFSAVCPHASGDLGQGTLHKGRIDCPDHGYRFDIRSGRPVWPEDEVCRLKRYPVKVEAGLVMVQIT